MTSRPRVNHNALLSLIINTLRERGQATESAVTSSTAPFSGRPLADLLFVPAAGLYAGTPHVVEIKSTSVSLAPDFIILSAISSAQKVRQANPGLDLRLAVAVTAPVTAAQGLYAAKHGVKLLSAPNLPDELVLQIEEWSGVDRVPSVAVLNVLRDQGMHDPKGGQLLSGTLWRIGELPSGRPIYVDYSSWRGRTPSVRAGNDGSIIVDREADAARVQTGWKAVLAEASSYHSYPA